MGAPRLVEVIHRLQDKLAETKRQSRELQKSLNAQAFQFASSGQQAMVQPNQALTKTVQTQWGPADIHLIPDSRAKDIAAMRAQGDALRDQASQACFHVLAAPASGLCLIIGNSGETEAAPSSGGEPPVSAVEVAKVLTESPLLPGTKGGGKPHLAQLKLSSVLKGNEKGEQLLDLLTRSLES